MQLFHVFLFICCSVCELNSASVNYVGFTFMEGRSAIEILTGKPIGKKPLGRPRRKWEDNIRIIEKLRSVMWSACRVLQTLLAL